MEACLEAFDRLSVSRSDRIFYAILFHDIVYDVHSSKNEELSAEFALKWLVEHAAWNPEKADEVASLILLTKNHWAYSGSDEDVKSFLDIDIGILGQPVDIYHRYRQGIRQEWIDAGRSEFLFSIGRLFFLKKVIKRDQIFLSKEFQKRFTNQARENLIEERKLILSQHGPFMRALLSCCF